jgi:dTMP kinase
VNRMRGALIAFEGLDQSGKQTQTDALAAALTAAGHTCERLSFPDYSTAIGTEIHKALHGEREYAPDVMQLLYVANRYEYRARLETWIGAGRIIVCDRYTASSVAYGEAQGLDARWLTEIQRFLPAADLTLLLDIAPRVAVDRKATNRDRYERDVELLTRVRSSYRAQSSDPAWALIPGDRARADVSAAVLETVRSRLGLL